MIVLLHYDVIKWNFFPRYWPLVGNSPVTSEFPSQRPVTRIFDVCFDLRLNKRLSKQSWYWWFDTPSRPLWRHGNGIFGGVLFTAFLKNSSRYCYAVRMEYQLGSHDDVIEWKHFPRYRSFVRGIHRSGWIPLTKTSDAELSCFLWSVPE